MAIYIKKKVNGVEQEPKRVGVIPNGYPARKITHSSGGNLEEMLNYSTDEHIVGKWIDGSILYEKTVNFGALPNNTTKTVAHNITNLSKIVEIRGTAFNSSNGAIPLPLLISSTDVSDLAVNVSLSLTLTDVVIKCMTNRSAYNGYITIRYTKTA